LTEGGGIALVRTLAPFVARVRVLAAVAVFLATRLAPLRAGTRLALARVGALRTDLVFLTREAVRLAAPFFAIFLGFAFAMPIS
jgi:hypothetical protein